MVGLLWLAHDQACEAELAATLTGILDGQGLPDLRDLQERFQRPGKEPADVVVDIPQPDTYDDLLTARRWPHEHHCRHRPAAHVAWHAASAHHCPSLAGLLFTSGQEGWPASRLLAALAELELAEREQRRIQRHLTEARLPPGKTDAFDFSLVPTLSKAQVMALTQGDAWLKAGLSGIWSPGAGKSHAAAAIGNELVARGYRVFFTRTTDLVQRLQAARQSLTLTQEIARLDRFDLLILDDLSYVRKDQAETSVLFELISARYERRSIMITANQPFSGWDSILDKAMTVAAIDRLVHHATMMADRELSQAIRPGLSDIAPRQCS
jgi:DNA replication protein DnaC